jgi:thioredoxin
MTTIASVTDASFQEDVLAAPGTTVVEFWAEWCGPCRALTPILESESEARGVALAKVDTDANPELANRYGIRGIPAVKAFRDGEVVREFVGALPRLAVAEFLDALTSPPARERLIAELTAAGELPDVVAALERDDAETALALLSDEIVAADGERRERLLALTVALFGELGHEHPLTARFRRQLAARLY